MKWTLLVLALIAAPRLAAAGELSCPLSQPGSVTVDGMLDDWDGVAPVRAGGKDADASFAVRCVYDGAKLAISIDVRDDKLVRIKKAKGKKLLGEDRVEIKLKATGKTLTYLLFPGKERIAPRRLIGGIKGKKTPKWLVIEDTQQPEGWSIELELPLSKIGGWSTATATLDATVTFHDADVASEKKTQESVAGALTLALGDAAHLLEQFLKDTKHRRSQITLDKMANVDPTLAGDERIVAVGTVIALLTDTYAYAALPVDGAANVLSVQLVDLRGDTTRQVLVRVRQRGGGGSRDLLLGYSAARGQLEQIFAIEIRKELDGNRLESTVTVAKAGTRRKLKKKQKVSGEELIVEAKPAVGWDDSTFNEIPAGDAEPIHEPWDPARVGGVYWLDGDALQSQDLAATKK